MHYIIALSYAYFHEGGIIFMLLRYSNCVPSPWRLSAFAIQHSTFNIQLQHSAFNIQATFRQQSSRLADYRYNIHTRLYAQMTFYSLIEFMLKISACSKLVSQYTYIILVPRYDVMDDELRYACCVISRF